MPEQAEGIEDSILKTNVYIAIDIPLLNAENDRNTICDHGGEKDGKLRLPVVDDNSSPSYFSSANG